MLVLLKLWKAVLGLLLGLALGWFVMVPTARENGRAAGYAAGNAAGITEERVVHEEARRKAEAQADQDRRAAQVRIDAIELEYLNRDQARIQQMDALEQSLQAEQANVPTPSPAARGAPPVCRPAIPRGVRDALDAAGRGAAPRPSAGEPPAALR